MKGYKCDLCGEWIEGEAPNKKGWKKYVDYKALRSMSISAVVWTGSSTKDRDICHDCFLILLKQFIEQY